MSTSMQDRIRDKCNALADMLIAKNEAYGNSAISPLRIFSKAPASEGIKVRIDDKLSRIVNNPSAFGEDVIKDLLGYLILLQIFNDIESEDNPK